MKIVELDDHTAINIDKVAYYTIYPNENPYYPAETKVITVYFAADIAPLVTYVDDLRALRFHNDMLNAGVY